MERRSPGTGDDGPGGSGADDAHDLSAGGTVSPADLTRALFEQSPFSTVIYDPAGRVVAINPAFTKLMGLGPDQVPPDYSILTDPQLDPVTVMPLIRRAFAGESVSLPPVRYDAAVYGSAGRATWTQAQIYPVRDKAGAIVRVVLVHVDLSARMEVETALESSRADLETAHRRLGAILNAVGSGITVQEVSGRIVYANDAAARLSGFASAEEFLAAPVEAVLSRFDLLDENGDPLPPEALPGRRAAAGEAAPERLLRYRIRATGEEHWSHLRSRAIAPGDGEPTLIVSVFDDVTEARDRQLELEAATAQLEELTREQEITLEELGVRSAENEAARAAAEWAEEQWKFLAEASRILAGSLEVEATLASIARLAVPRIADWCTVHIVDDDGAVRRIEVAHADPRRLEETRDLERKYPPNPATSGIHRVIASGRAELYPVITEDLLKAAAHDEEHLRLLKSLNLTSAMIVPLRSADRTHGAITLVGAESGRVYDERDLAFAESLAERAGASISSADLYQRAQEANRAKSEFLAVMSHELRTPLNAILGYSEILDEGISGGLNQRQREQLDRIRQSARHLTELIDTVLAFARVEAGRDEVRHSDVDVAEIAREAVAFVEPAARKKGLVIQDAEIRSVHVVTDVAKLRQILLNLLSNAVKFTDRGSISVATAASNGRATIRVTDTGVGIPPESLPRIWEPFTQLDSALTRREGGTGLGLPVSAALAEMLGGSISATSEVGSGSTFVLTVPTEPEADEASSPD